MPFSPDLSHRDDPQTSGEAADAAANEGLVDTHEWRILTVLRSPTGRGGWTGKELAAAITERWGVATTNVQVMRRMGALVARDQAHRLRDTKHPDRWRRRDGQVLHFYGESDLPLFNL